MKFPDTNSKEYRAWLGMKNRCKSEKQFYGGRVTICAAWKKSFRVFFADMGPAPSPKHTLERNDNDGNYEPGNCRWATHAEQCKNRRSNIRLTLDGKTMVAADWSRELGISKNVISQRVKCGMSDREVLLTPCKKFKKRGGAGQIVQIITVSMHPDRLRWARAQAKSKCVSLSKFISELVAERMAERSVSA